ncbi:DUF6332 family protein [Streptomyces sp. NPDC048606]|uniref:DUF6332 family protein n=1 Tax=Streptomyces sp. NPDC048606 TaxID=3154726 RepID=UPI00342B9E7D
MDRSEAARRDAVTVEIGYAFVTGCLAAAVVFAALYGLAWALPLPAGTDGTAMAVSGVLAGAAFLARVGRVLWRFDRTGSDGPGSDRAKSDRTGSDDTGPAPGPGGCDGQPSVEA